MSSDATTLALATEMVLLFSAEPLIDAVARVNASLQPDGGGAEIRDGMVWVWRLVDGRRLEQGSLTCGQFGGGPLRFLRPSYVEAMERWVRNPERYAGVGVPGIE